MTDTRFKKGRVPWNKKTLLKKVCKCGKTFYVKPSLDRVKSCSVSCGQKGKTGSQKQRDIISAIMTGNQYGRGREPWNKGLIGYKAGEAHYNWKGASTERHLAMQRLNYKSWRENVFGRDNYTCQVCEQYGGYLHADHIKSWKDHEELRFEVSNGRTLCVACHYYITFKRKMPTGSKWGLVGMTRKIG